MNLHLSTSILSVIWLQRLRKELRQAIPESGYRNCANHTPGNNYSFQKSATLRTVKLTSLTILQKKASRTAAMAANANQPAMTDVQAKDVPSQASIIIFSRVLDILLIRWVSFTYMIGTRQFKSKKKTKDGFSGAGSGGAAFLWVVVEACKSLYFNSTFIIRVFRPLFLISLEGVESSFTATCCRRDSCSSCSVRVCGGWRDSCSSTTLWICGGWRDSCSSTTLWICGCGQYIRRILWLVLLTNETFLITTMNFLF